tara:strand:+ start:409 stop:1500 length:1092 start_codon:yes stop_codon:yes gene_type:complete
MKKIELFDLSINKSIKKEFISEIDNLIEKNDWIMGDAVRNFENKLQNFLSTNFCISVNSGTDALELSLRALGIKSGDKVIVPAFSFFATSEAVLKIGATPIYCDISRDNLNIDIKSLKNKIDGKVKSIIPVHLFGNAANLEELTEFADRYELSIIEDVAQAFGSKINNKHLGTFGDVGCFSFYPTKNLGGFGDGGCVVTDNQKIAENISYLRNHGQTKKYYHEFVGYNSRLDNIQAKILNIKLTNIDIDIELKIEHCKTYAYHLKGNKNILIHNPYEQPLNLYPISFSSSNKLELAKKELEKNNVSFGNYYPYGLHQFPISKHDDSKLNQTEWAIKNILTLPVHKGLKKEDIVFISTILNSVA